MGLVLMRQSTDRFIDRREGFYAGSGGLGVLRRCVENGGAHVPCPWREHWIESALRPCQRTGTVRSTDTSKDYAERQAFCQWRVDDLLSRAELALPRTCPNSGLSS